MFLDSIREKQEEEERQRKEKDGEEIRQFKEAVAARSSAVNNPAPAASNPTPKPAVPPQPPTTRRDKKSLKGVVVKRKTNLKPQATTGVVKGTTGDDTRAQPDAKRRKL